MNGELGLGRTWWVAIVIIVGATVAMILKIMPLDSWLELVKWIFAAAAGKSAVQQVATKIGRRTEP